MEKGKSQMSEKQYTERAQGKNQRNNPPKERKEKTLPKKKPHVFAGL
jgi:hypothetical protein